MSLGFYQKLPAKAIIVSSTQNNNSLTTETNSAQSSDLSQFFTTTTSQSIQNSNTECNLSKQAGTSVPEPTLITGLIFVAGLGVWSQKKKKISNTESD
ncbi:hypothetical protein [Dapis sp. BLCC M172]|uniref:hypothetical protein n=1 Tax=Dapis sp. BLCC M172 TaxID=2975281 RepID=UPI003CEC006A